MGRKNELARQRRRAKHTTCPRCGAPPNHRCANLARVRVWYPGILKREQNRHVHFERIVAQQAEEAA